MTHTEETLSSSWKPNQPLYRNALCYILREDWFYTTSRHISNVRGRKHVDADNGSTNEKTLEREKKLNCKCASVMGFGMHRVATKSKQITIASKFRSRRLFFILCLRFVFHMERQLQERALIDVFVDFFKRNTRVFRAKSRATFTWPSYLFSITDGNSLSKKKKKMARSSFGEQRLLMCKRNPHRSPMYS